jgi:lipoprotein-releasing system permease protein
MRSRESVDGILLKGVDSEHDVSDVGKFVVAGKFDLDRVPGAIPKIVVGKKLATRLSLSVGDKATVFGMTRLAEGGQMRARQFLVSGIYESGMAEYDDVYAFTSLADAQIVFQLGDAVTGYDVLVTDLDSIKVASDQLEALLGYPHYARTVFENYRNLFTWIELQKEPVPIILGLIITVATVNIIGTLLMCLRRQERLEF